MKKLILTSQLPQLKISQLKTRSLQEKQMYTSRMAKKLELLRKQCGGIISS